MKVTNHRWQIFTDSAYNFWMKLAEGVCHKNELRDFNNATLRKTDRSITGM